MRRFGPPGHYIGSLRLLYVISYIGSNTTYFGKVRQPEPAAPLHQSAYNSLQLF